MVGYVKRAMRRDAGAVTTELAVVMSFFLVAFVYFVVFAGRVAQAENEVRSAAQEAARAATLTGDTATAEAVANQVAGSNLVAAGVACTDLDVVVDASGLTPGSYVTVSLSCTAQFGDVTALGVPGSRQYTATASEIVDVYRSEAS